MRRFLSLPFLLLIFLSALGVAAAQETDGPAANVPISEAAHVRFALFSADPVLVDVYMNGALSDAKGLEFPQVTEWMTVPAGTYELAVTPAGEPYEDSVLGPTQLTLQPMTWTTVAIIGSLGEDDLQIAAIPESTGNLRPGTARVTFFNAVDKGDSVNFYRNERPFVTLVGFGNTFTEEMDVDTYMLQAVTPGQDPQVLAELPEVGLRENRNYLVAAVGVPGTAGETAPQLVTAETTRGEMVVGLGLVEAPGTIVEAVDAENLTGDLATVIEAADMTETLQGEGPFTLFAPAELRLEDLGTKTPEELAAFLNDHIVTGEVLSQDLAQEGTLQTLSGGTLDVEVRNNAFYVNGARVLTVNLPARNGVIHLIGEPLSPPEIGG